MGEGHDATDPLDRIQADLARVLPGEDTSGVAVTGRLLRLARQVEDRREQRLRDFGLTPADYDVLATLRRRSGSRGLNPGEVQRAVMVTSGGMTKRLDRLEQAGLLERRPDPDDRRGVRVRLTRSGRSTIDRSLRAVLAMERDLVAAAVPAASDRGRLTSLLRQLLVALEPPDDGAG